ncbi:hypothetical protein Ae201684P_004001 [Aphanomyces euteiches]|uniref:Uncharacterized protein n=1 Tax=Aphanomyces euteiches TaxID=100861 RepID=A0A6G0XT21_9STRA|nr:hypothetical protein Ae201684_001408 [Aphanomyces euteiches]KAH9075320.1 hypothetical protein Ae201684P_004001 [Aphanomyces euteiches]
MPQASPAMLRASPELTCIFRAAWPEVFHVVSGRGSSECRENGVNLCKEKFTTLKCLRLPKATRKNFANLHMMSDKISPARQHDDTKTLRWKR